MNTQKLFKIADYPVGQERLLAQDRHEWQAFLMFTEAYFKNMGIKEPVVVEIGIMKGVQKLYYKTILGAKHFGIDCNINAEPDILGDSQSKDTVTLLKEMTGGAKIDLLFIDGNHSYDAAKRDYELWEAETAHLVAFHDIRATNNSKVARLWEEIRVDKMTVEFNRYNTQASILKCKMVDMGIGVIIKGNE